MSLVAAAMRELMVLGVEGDALIAAVDRIVSAAHEENTVTLAEALARAASKSDFELERRRAKDRERKRFRGNPRKSADSVEAAPPSPEPKGPPDPLKNPTPSSPPTPPKGGPSPHAKPAAQEVNTIWALQPVINGKRRSTRPDVERALTAAMGRGGVLAEIEAGCRAYYRLDDCQRDGGQFAMGAARLLERDRWREFGSAPDGLALGADWSEDRWRHAVALYREGVPWKPELGPPPDAPGCRAPVAVLGPRTVLPFPHRSASA